MATRVMFDIPMVRGLDVLTNPATTAGVTVVGADSGKVFCSTNTGATTYTLPSLVDGTGKIFWFFLTNTTGTMVITAPSACMIMNDTTGTTNTCAATAGSWVMVTCDGTSYYCFEGLGTWTAA